MPSNRLLFQLAPLEPRTEEIEYLLLQTPTSVQTEEEPEKMRERAERNGYKNGTKYGSLTSQIKYDPKAQTFLKTPCTADSYTDSMKSKGVSGTSGTLAQEIMSGYAEKHRGLILPTPRCNQVNGCDLNNPNIAERNKYNLEEEVAKIVVSQGAAAGQTSRLSPLFTEEMMGFPLMWTTLPFLSTNGAQKASKHTETQ